MALLRRHRRRRPRSTAARPRRPELAPAHAQRALTSPRRRDRRPVKRSALLSLVHRAGCHCGVMAVSDYSSGKVLTTVPIGAGVDGAAFDPATDDLFASNLDGTLTIIHQDKKR